MWVIIAAIMYMCSGNARGHEPHLADVGTLTKIEMQYCIGYIVVKTEELGIIVLYKAGDMTHKSMHYTRADEFGCVYEIVKED
jgi:hypothetical protein